MKKLFIALLLLSSTASADNKVIGHQTPLKTEMLQNPLHLSDVCANVKITEWKNTYSSNSLDNISNICNKVSNKFYYFVKSKGYNPRKVNPKFNLSILPHKVDNGGFEYRGLNDTKFRFKFRTKSCGNKSNICKKGETPAPVNGYLEYNEKYIYIRNDVDTHYFARALAHEFFHMFSYLSGVQDQENNWQVDDERLAYEFTDQFWPN